MNKEIGRKFTSLTLLSILLASGVTFAVPGAIPVAEAAHNANLFVSAENSQFSNYFAGPQVIEVVINDPNISDTDEGKGEPDVTVNGNKLRMVQATDGNWYGYLADRAQAQAADATQDAASGEGLDFGEFCDNNSDLGDGSNIVTFGETVGVAIADHAVTGGVDGTTPIEGSAVCVETSIPVGGAHEIHVVREQKTPSSFPNATATGQIGINPDAWPFVQLYDLSVGGNVVIQYNKGGGVQTTTLTFDTIPSNLITHTLDRTNYPQGAAVHTTMTDPQLNIDPTDEDSWTWDTIGTSTNVYYQLFDENGGADVTTAAGAQDLIGNLTTLMFEKNGRVTVDLAAQGTTVAAFNDNADQVFPLGFTPNQGALSQQMTFVELSVKSGIFGNYDESDNANLDITSTAERGKSATIRYNDVTKSIVVGFGFGTLDINVADGEWSSGEEVPVTLVDSDANKNSRSDEDLDLNSADVALIPSLKIGNPFTLATGDKAVFSTASPSPTAGGTGALGTLTGTNRTALNSTGTTVGSVDAFSQRALLAPNATATSASSLIIGFGSRTAADLQAIVQNPIGTFDGLNMFNDDIRSLSLAAGTIKIYLLHRATPIVSDGGVVPTGVTAISLANVTSSQSLISLNSTDSPVLAEDATTINSRIAAIPSTNSIGLLIDFPTTTISTGNKPIVADFFSFGFTGDGLKTDERINNAIYRFELEETGDNTSTFIGSAEFTMLSQVNILDDPLYKALRTIDDEVTFIVHEDLTDEDAPRVNYLDLGSDGVSTQIADQQDADTHSATVSFDKDTYKVADTVTVTLEDQDLNVDSDTIDIYVTFTPSGDPADDTVGEAGLGTLSTGDPLGRLLDITFDDIKWQTKGGFGGTCTATSADTGLNDAGFSLVETGAATGVFRGDFQIPADFCPTKTGAPVSTTGLDLEVNYVDFRDGSGETIEVGDGAGVRANTGSISLDRSVYPTPFGKTADFTATTGSSPDGRSIFPVHATGITGSIGASETIGEGELNIHVRVNDPDFDISAAGEDKIQQDRADQATGPVKITVSRGSAEVTLAYAGGPAAQTGRIDVDDNSPTTTREVGPITEIAPNAGIFELDFTILYTDGPASTNCPATTTFTSLGGNSTESGRFDAPSTTGDYCILQGDIITVEYTDPTDASGDPNSVTDSATFDLRNGVLQSDKSVYIIGADMIMTLIDPDLDLDSDAAESYDLDLIEWDSDAATVTMGDLGGEAAAFDPEPSDFRETGDSTGIFQIVIEIPNTLDGERLDRGEEIELEYTDWGPSGADHVGDEDEDINLTIYTSNFGATVELDQKVYTWTDKVFITIVAPDHNFDSNLVDEIGDSDVDKIQVATRGEKLSLYKLVETGTDTGIFTGEVILTGFTNHDADGDGDTSDATGSTTGTGPTGGFLAADDDDGLTVSFEFTEDETVVGSALIRWNIGEVQFLEASYPATGQGVLRVVDPDLNLNPEAVDNFDVDVWSDSDAGGIDLTVTETNEATGIFEGTVFFTVTDESSGHRLRVSEGDTVTGEYEDNTLPSPYTTADELEVTATTFIGTIVPPLERAPASNPRVVDAFGNELDEVSVDQQVQIAADLANGQDRDQPFAYLVQISKGGVTYSLSWITGSLAPGQSLNPAQSWTPTESGTYDVQIFVWESVDNPDALSPPVETTVTVV